MRGSESALQVHVDHGIPVGLLHVEDHAVAEDAGVVDEDVEPAELVDGLFDHPSGLVEVGDIGPVDDRFAAGRADLVDDAPGRSHIATRSVDITPEIVDDDLGAPGSQQQSVLAPDTPPRSGDDCHSTFDQSTHVRPPARRDGRHGNDRRARSIDQRGQPPVATSFSSTSSGLSPSRRSSQYGLSNRANRVPSARSSTSTPCMDRSSGVDFSSVSLATW